MNIDQNFEGVNECFRHLVDSLPRRNSSLKDKTGSNLLIARCSLADKAATKCTSTRNFENRFVPPPGVTKIVPRKRPEKVMLGGSDCSLLSGRLKIIEGGITNLSGVE